MAKETEVKYNSLEEKYSQHTLGLYWRLTKIALVGTGFAILVLITAIITRPAVSDVVPRVIMYSFLAAAALCVFLIIRRSFDSSAPREETS